MSGYRDPDRAHLQEDELAAIYEADLEKERAERKARQRRSARLFVVALAALAVVVQVLFVENFAENGLTVNGWAPPAIFVGFIFAIGLLSNWGTRFYERKRKDFATRKLEADSAAFLATRVRVSQPAKTAETAGLAEPVDEPEEEGEQRRAR